MTGFMIPEPVVALGVAAKASLVLMTAWGITTMLRRRSAALRHGVWTLALTSVVAMVLLTPIAPRIAVRVPITIVDGASRGVTAGDVRGALGIISALWAIGAVTVGLWFATGHLALAWLRARARPARLRRRQGRAHVLWSPDVAAPLCWGWARPVILLPNAARRWPSGRLRAALLHERAHIDRRDPLTLVLTGVACTLFWFHPLVWFAAHRMRAESERACDDRVLLGGVEPADYAAHLVAVARAASRIGWLLPATGMAGAPDLERRVREILDDSRSRRLEPRLLTVLIVGWALLLAPLTTLRTQLAPRVAAPAPHHVASLER